MTKSPILEHFTSEMSGQRESNPHVDCLKIRPFIGKAASESTKVGSGQNTWSEQIRPNPSISLFVN
jgi:hypothetical protein